MKLRFPATLIALAASALLFANCSSDNQNSSPSAEPSGPEVMLEAPAEATITSEYLRSSSVEDITIQILNADQTYDVFVGTLKYMANYVSGNTIQNRQFKYINTVDRFGTEVSVKEISPLLSVWGRSTRILVAHYYNESIAQSVLNQGTEAPTTYVFEHPEGTIALTVSNTMIANLAKKHGFNMNTMASQVRNYYLNSADTYDRMHTQNWEEFTLSYEDNDTQNN